MQRSFDEIAEEVASGISTGGDNIFRISKSFAEKNNFEKDLLYPVLVGGEIDSYQLRNENHVIIYTKKDITIENHHNIYKYLIPFESKLSQKRETKKGTLPWWCLHWSRYKDLFTGEKIIMRQTADSIRATYDDNGFFVLNSILVFKIKKEFNINPKFAVAILNSKLNNFIYKSITQEEGRTFAEVKPKNVRKLYIPKLDDYEQKWFVGMVDEILTITKDEDYLQDTEKQKKVSDFKEDIDNEVYRIYGIMDEKEIAIVEGTDK